MDYPSMWKKTRLKTFKALFHVVWRDAKWDVSMSIMEMAMQVKPTMMADKNKSSVFLSCCSAVLKQEMGIKDLHKPAKVDHLVPVLHVFNSLALQKADNHYPMFALSPQEKLAAI